MSSLAQTSDVDVFSDINSVTEASSQPSFLRIGQHDNYYQWTQSVHDRFLDWWLNTPWAVTRTADSTINIVKQLSWNSSIRKSDSWQHFYQAAHQITGEPVLICQICHLSLIHPNAKGHSSGTTSLKKHLVSATCQKASSRASHREGRRQANIDSSFSSVSYFD
jgi:hypothetical protein